MVKEVLIITVLAIVATWAIMESRYNRLENQRDAFYNELLRFESEEHIQAYIDSTDQEYEDDQSEDYRY